MVTQALLVDGPAPLAGRVVPVPAPDGRPRIILSIREGGVRATFRRRDHQVPAADQPWPYDYVTPGTGSRLLGEDNETAA